MTLKYSLREQSESVILLKKKLTMTKQKQKFLILDAEQADIQLNYPKEVTVLLELIYLNHNCITQDKKLLRNR